jgi:hypothetical protein
MGLAACPFSFVSCLCYARVEGIRAPTVGVAVEVVVNGTARTTMILIATRSNSCCSVIYPPVIQTSRLRRKKFSQKETVWGGRLTILVAGSAANVSFPRDRQPDAVTRPRPHAARSSGPSTAGWPPAGSCRVAGITSPAGRSVERTGAVGRTARPHGHRRLAKIAPVQSSSPPSRPAYGPARRLQQLDALSDEGRGVLVLRVWDQLPHEVPRRLIHAEGDDSRFSCHSLTSFACGRDRRLNSIRASTVLFMDGSVGRARGERRQPDSERFRSIPRT